MKTLLIALLLMFGTAQANEVEVKLLKMTRISNDDSFYTGDWSGIELSYHFDNSPWYVYGGYEETGVYAGGRIWDYNFMGLGVGLNHQVSKHISIFGQIGYYFVENSLGGPSREFNEAVHYYLNSLWQNSLPGPYDVGEYWIFDETQVTNGDTLGVSVGMDISYPISKNWSAGFSLSYRYMNIDEHIAGYRDEWGTVGWWELDRSHDYSSFNTGISLNHTF